MKMIKKVVNNLNIDTSYNVRGFISVSYKKKKSF